MKWYIKVLENSEFEGRARRKEFWIFHLIDWAIRFILILLCFFTNSQTALIIFFLYALILLPPSIAVSIRRLHDSNWNGWWWFSLFIPIIGPIFFLVLMCLDSNKNDNQYGPSPKYK